jgi:hypothetical protein
LALAEKSRHHITEAEKYRVQIEKHLLSLFPSLEGKSEDGPEDWSCDIINTANDGDVIHTLDRIDKIEQKRVKTLKLNVLSDHLDTLQNELSKIENQIAQAEAEFNKLKQS